jgi:hypothetical protein
MVAQKFVQVICLDEQMYAPIPKRFPEKENRNKKGPSAIHNIWISVFGFGDLCFEFGDPNQG